MASPAGPGDSGDFADDQLRAARVDPRTRRGGESMVADFHDAIEEAERVRELGVWGVHELRESIENEERRLGVSRDSPNLTAEQMSALQAARERSVLAEAEIENEHPHLHAMALISMQSALDAMVEKLAPQAQQRVFVPTIVHQLLKRAREKEPAAWKALTDEQREALPGVLDEWVKEQQHEPGRVHGAGARRYEEVLAAAGLQAPPDRAIPPGLDLALAELTALRNVLVHQGGRVDETALRVAPSLSYEEGEFVRLGRSEYRRYSAAVRAYGFEVIRRLLGEVAGGLDLENWERAYRINA